MEFTAFHFVCVHQSKGSKPTVLSLEFIDNTTRLWLTSSHHDMSVLAKPKQNLARKQVAAVTAALQQPVRNKLDTQDRMKNKLVKSLPGS